MGDDNLMDVNLTDLDLNQEPTDPPLPSVARVGFLLNDIETAQYSIDERIRLLEAVCARPRHRQRWRQARNSTEISHISSEMMVDVNSDGINNMGIRQRTAEKRKGCKRDSSHLVAEALGVDSEVNKANKEGGSFYDCNICLDLAREPVLTSCGHLFCWACFYQVSNVDSTSKECPVCKGEVSESTVVPIYGNASSERVCETEYGLKIPPRPKARRVESVRQQKVTRNLSHVPVDEALRRIRASIGAMGDQTQQREGSNGIIYFDTASRDDQNGDSGRVRIHQVSRVLSENVASLSSLSSALSSAERLVEDLETVISSRVSRNDTQASSVAVGTVLQSNDRPLDSTSDLNAALPVNPSSQSNDVSGSAVHILTRRTSSGISLPVAPSYSLRRRSVMPRNSDVDSRDTRESRRRRLN
ncbi:hypothetical protein DH2020_002715 [Rehmannia glutinosa]|uniref:E3 ubiquitin-protein ligase RMA n=1 Tax=Rehmannia glutinosa TaxID=99300 RepID=A0ABR0XUK6_REHGL